MGLEDRDYIRKSGSGGASFGGSAFPPVCKWLIIANVGVYLLSIFVPGLVHWLDLSLSDLGKGQIWRLLTTGFCHSRHDLFHILFNMVFLVWFGRTLEQGFGSREFLRFFLYAVVASSVAYAALQLYTGEDVPVIGASGGVMAVVVVYALLFPRQVIYVFFVIPVEIRWLVLIYVIFDLHPVLLTLAGEGERSGVAHAAHLGGAIFGFCYWKFGWILSRGGRRGGKPHRGKKKSWFGGKGSRPKVGGPPHGEQERDVDAILQKISEHGQKSLTDRERRILEDASKRYRDRSK